MKQLLLSFALMLAASMMSAQIQHQIFGVHLGTKQQTAMETWTEKGVELEQSSHFKDLYRIVSTDKGDRTNPAQTEVIFLHHRLFSVRYTYPRDHYSTICDLIRITYTPYFKFDDEGYKGYYDPQTRQFINIGCDDEHTYLTYGVNMSAENNE